MLRGTRPVGADMRLGLELSVWPLAALLVLGCVELWWKAGAGTDELERDKSACRAQATAERDFGECMAERGWWHSKGATTPAAGASEGAGQAPKAAGTPGKPAAARHSPPAPATGASTAAETVGLDATPIPARDSSSSGAGIFWKMGASAQELAEDQAVCLEKSVLRVERLSGPRWGESADFDRCMYGLGWRGGPR